VLLQARSVGTVAYGASVPGSTPDADPQPEPSGFPPAAGAARRVLPAVRQGRAGRGAGEPVEAAGDEHVVEVRRSARRRRTVTAYRELGRTVVLIPAAFSPAEERRWVAQMVAKLQTREERRRRSLGGDDELMTRAMALSIAHLDGAAEPASVRWVDNQHRRWGSCTPADRSIRLSSRLRSMPEYVVDYVLVHELVHLLEPGHDERFWALVARYPRAERARGFLEGIELATTAGAAGDDGGPAPSAVD
jgi:predicted metal-dependent hydrolase